MFDIEDFIQLFGVIFPEKKRVAPWELTTDLAATVAAMIMSLHADYIVGEGVAIHNTAVVEAGVILKAPVIIGAHCFIGSNSCLRGGVYMAPESKIGTGCEVKSSILFNNSAIAHFNFIGDSIIGSNVNFEAGSITANHYNERSNKSIPVIYNGRLIDTGAVKFGSLVGDDCKIGANAVLSPGTLLTRGTVVKRLELIDQASAHLSQS